ncbi:unnamed protein product [Vitrella brassicaformis CCMP3155]|uniref:Peptidase M41 domain-containing protein n=1 Tax=Vitrella brassicaformis (strain CCMP3155) TaxID=1169540 RepID=A0A0G4GRU2_VITBC|nr:unnamed protein product [Vitrella brassicaformis CCMP3155]|eukprot:CEM33345.1 unnamed protein product [Vitrella brassicaformis CCMP3155]
MWYLTASALAILSIYDALAFQPSTFTLSVPRPHLPVESIRRRPPRHHLYASSDDADVQKLLEEAAKLREEASAMEVQKAKDDEADRQRQEAEAAKQAAMKPADAPQTNAAAAPPPAEARLLTSPVASVPKLPLDSAVACATKLDELKEQGVIGYWNSEARPSYYNVESYTWKASTGCDDNAIQSKSGETDFFQRLFVGTLIVSTLLAIGSSQFIGGNLGALFTYLFAALPIVVVAIGSINPGVLLGLYTNVQNAADGSFKERRRWHEASHFLVGYLLGYPPRRVVKAPETSLVEFYESRDDSQDRRQPLERSTLEPLCVVAISGISGELLKYKTAKDTDVDINYIQNLMKRTQPQLSGGQQTSIPRWSSLAAYQILEKHQPVVDELAGAMGGGADISECIRVVENAMIKQYSSQATTTAPAEAGAVSKG